MAATRSPITTHVLDTAAGKPAANVAAVLERQSGANWTKLAAGATDADGRIDAHVKGWLPAGARAEAGTYRLTFETGAYFGGKTFYPVAVIVFELRDPAAHHHVPLLLSPYGLSTYRGS